MRYKIEMNRKYKYRDGVEVRILCVDAPGLLPVIALSPDGSITYHMMDGHCPGAKELDLFEDKEPEFVWVGVYEKRIYAAPSRLFAQVFRSEVEALLDKRTMADKCMSDYERIRLIKIDLNSEPRHGS